MLGGCLCLYALLPPKTESSSAFLWRGCPLYLSSPGLLSRGCHVEASAAQRCLLQRPNSLTGPIPTCPDLHPTQPHPSAATRASLGSFKSSRHSSPCGPWPVPCLLQLTTRQESGQRDLLKAVTTTTCNKQLPSSVSRALGGTCGVTQPPERWPWKSRRDKGKPPAWRSGPHPGPAVITSLFARNAKDSPDTARKRLRTSRPASLPRPLQL